MFAGKKSAQIREILINESAWEEMTCLFAPSLNDLREKFNGKVFKVNEQIISRFQIKNTPALITTDQDKFRITLFSEAEVRGIGAPNLSEEK